MLLAGDIGGTKTDLAVFDIGPAGLTTVARAEFPSAAYPDLTSIVREFLQGQDVTLESACFAVAGPVVAGHAEITNLPWVLDSATLERELGLEAAYLLNDLEAIAWAVPRLGPDSLRTLNAGSPAAHGAIGVIAPGTGLGEAYLTWGGERYQAHASEGGHADFAPTSEPQVGLLRFLWKRFEHVSYETVCSGIGIPHIYAYLRDSGYAPESPDVAAQLATVSDPTPTIVQAGLRPDDPSSLCAATVDLFVSILAAEAGNLAMKVLATGGIYIAGGLPLHVLPALNGPRFVEIFRSKGRFEDLLSRVPIHVVLHRTALTGAARYALEQMLPHAVDPDVAIGSGIATQSGQL